MNNLKLNNTSLSKAKIIIRQKKKDNRGYLSRLFCIDELKKKKYNENIKQINLSFTQKKKNFKRLSLPN